MLLSGKRTLGGQLLEVLLETLETVWRAFSYGGVSEFRLINLLAVCPLLLHLALLLRLFPFYL